MNSDTVRALLNSEVSRSHQFSIWNLYLIMLPAEEYGYCGFVGMSIELGTSDSFEPSKFVNTECEAETTTKLFEI